MPIVTIQSSIPIESIGASKMISEIRESGAQALQSTPDNIWVIFQFIETKFHSENIPPVVTIKAQAGRSSQAREAFVKTVATAVGDALAVSPESVWLYYQEMKPQDVWFEGHWAG